MGWGNFWLPELFCEQIVLLGHVQNIVYSSRVLIPVTGVTSRVLFEQKNPVTGISVTGINLTVFYIVTGIRCLLRVLFGHVPSVTGIIVTGIIQTPE